MSHSCGCQGESHFYIHLSWYAVPRGQLEGEVSSGEILCPFNSSIPPQMQKKTHWDKFFSKMSSLTTAGVQQGWISPFPTLGTTATKQCLLALLEQARAFSKQAPCLGADWVLRMAIPSTHIWQAMQPPRVPSTVSQGPSYPTPSDGSLHPKTTTVSQPFEDEEGCPWVMLKACLSQKGLEISFSLTPGAQFPLVSIRQLKMQDRKSRRTWSFTECLQTSSWCKLLSSFWQ